MLSFKLTFSLSSFTLIKRLSSFSLLSAIRVVSSVYLGLLIFLSAILIPACELSTLHFAGSQYTALTYSFPNLEPTCYSLYGSNCYFLTCIQISQEIGKVVWYSHLFKNFPQFVVIHNTVKSFGVLNKAKLDVFSGILLLFL